MTSGSARRRLAAMTPPFGTLRTSLPGCAVDDR
jgi:hypothetical protein